MAIANHSTSLTERKYVSYTEIHHNVDQSAKGKDLIHWKISNQTTKIL